MTVISMALMISIKITISDNGCGNIFISDKKFVLWGEALNNFKRTVLEML